MRMLCGMAGFVLAGCGCGIAPTLDAGGEGEMPNDLAGEEAPRTCTTNADCADSIDCTADSCNVGGTCTNAPDNARCPAGQQCVPRQNGCVIVSCTGPADCDDGNPCNGMETCGSTGVCQPGTPLACSDGLFCNGVEACDPAATGGCAPGMPPNCDDGLSCTTDTCAEAGSGATCMHADTCTPPTTCSASGCALRPCTTPAQCDDGNPCNGTETCSGGYCQAGSPPNCADAIACTVDTCDPAAGCVHTPDDSRCPDTVCASGGHCSSTGCTYAVLDDTACSACCVGACRSNGTCLCCNTRICCGVCL